VRAVKAVTARAKISPDLVYGWSAKTSGGEYPGVPMIKLLLVRSARELVPKSISRGRGSEEEWVLTMIFPGLTSR